MNKAVTLVLVLAACTHADDVNSELSSEGGRQKRLLFFDEEGSLVKTYSNPYMNQLSEYGQNLPIYGNYLNPFFNFIRHFGNSLISYTIPVSKSIIQNIKNNPEFQNTLVVIPKQGLIVAPNPLCEGKRTQIPAPNLCNNFLNCWDGWAFEQECPAGLMFSTQGYCDYAGNVDCRNRKLDANKPQAHPICSKDFESFRNQQNCNEFFICVNRQPIPFKCPADLAYSQVLGVCDYPDNVDCKSTGFSIAPVQQPSYPSPTPSPAGPVIPPSHPGFTPIIPEIPVIPPLPALPPASPATPILPPASPATPILPPASPALPPASPALPPASPALPPASPALPPALPAIPEIPPLAPVVPPASPTIPPAPAAIPPLPSLLPPGTFPQPIFPPVPPISVLPAPVPEGPPSENQPPYPDNIFLNPGCSPAINIAMSRQHAIRLLQETIMSKPSY